MRAGGPSRQVARRRLLRTAAGGLFSSLLLPAPARAAGTIRAHPSPRGLVFDVRAFGAPHDGKRLATRALQAAIDACGKAGGGTVLLPPGEYLSGPLFLRDNLHLEVSAGARLQATTDLRQFGVIDGRAGGVERKVHASLLTGINLSNVSIGGRGTIDGHGFVWQDAEARAVELIAKQGQPAVSEGKRVYPREGPLQHPRPRVVNLIRCQGVSLADLFIERSPHWTVHLVYCDDVAINGLRIGGTDKGLNTSGIVIDSSRDVRVSNCRLSPGDDGIAIKSGLDEDGRRVAFESSDIVIDNCTFLDSDGAGLAIGSEMSGGVRNVSISNCVFNNVKWGLRLKTNRGRGGVVENVRTSGLVIHKARQAAIEITGWHDRGIYQVPDAGAADTTPLFRHLRVADVLVSETPRAVVVRGLPERWFENVGVERIAARGCELGIECQHVEGLLLDSLTLEGPRSGPAVALQRCRDVEIRRLRLHRPITSAPAIQLEQVTGALITGCSAPPTLTALVSVKGPGTTGVSLLGNAVPPTALPSGTGVPARP